MIETLKQAKELGNSVKVFFGDNTYTGRIGELCENVVSLIVEEHYSEYTHKVTQQTKVFILIESITCVVVTIPA